MGMTPGSTGMNFLKGGLTGLSQGLTNYNNPHPVYDFSGLAKGFQDARQQKQQQQQQEQQQQRQQPQQTQGPQLPNLQLPGAPDQLTKLFSLFPQPKRPVLGSVDPNQGLDQYSDQPPEY